MFICFEELSYIGYDPTTKMHIHKYNVIDTDFEERIEIKLDIGIEVSFGAYIATMNIYEKRNLNVARNFVLTLKWHTKTYGYSIDEIINWNRVYNFKYSKYEQDVNKYLLLI